MSEVKTAVIGAGPAGIACVLGLLEARVPVVVLDQNQAPGGQLVQIPSPIVNVALGYWQNGESAARDLVTSLAQAKLAADKDGCSFDHYSNHQVTGLKIKDESITICGSKDIVVERLLLAPGLRVKQPVYEGAPETRLHVYTHAPKQKLGTIYKSAVVVGGGDSATLLALELTESLDQIYLVVRGKLKARPDVQAKLTAAHAKIKVLTDCRIKKIEAQADGERLEAVHCLLAGANSSDGQPLELSADVVIAKLGYQPNTEFLKGAIDLDYRGYIKTDGNLNVLKEGVPLKNIFAAGDATTLAASYPRITLAAGQGMQCAGHIIEQIFLKAQSKKSV